MGDVTTTMEYRKLGETGLEVSVLGFGASPLGEEFGKIDSSAARRAVRRAVDLGITYFDVAPYYGRELAEERLGAYLDGLRDRVVLATKAGRYGREAPEGFDFSASRMRSSLEESLRRLRTDYVDVFQIHDVEFGDTERIIAETVPAMQALKREGKVRAVGITGYPLQNLRRIAEAVEVDVILSYCRYNLVNRAMDEMLTPFTQEHGIGLVNASPLLMRALTEAGPPPWHPAPASARAAFARAARVAREAGTSLASVALRFALGHPSVATTLVGMAEPDRVEENASAVGRPVGADVLRTVEQALEPVMGLSWPVGRAENADEVSG